MAITKFEAIKSLCPTAEFVLVEEEIFEWHSEDIEQPSEEDINSELERLQTEYANNQYQRDRALAYPLTIEFIEAYTEKEILGDSTKWDAYVEKYNQVRADYPKP